MEVAHGNGYVRSASHMIMMMKWAAVLAPPCTDASHVMYSSSISVHRRQLAQAEEKED